MSKMKISDEQIIKLIKSGYKNSEIAKELGVKQANIHARLNQLRNAHPAPEATDKKEKESEIEKIAVGSLIEYQGEKCKVVAISPGRIILNTSAGQKSIKKDEYDCLRGILIQKGTLAPISEPEPQAEVKAEPVEDLGGASNQCNGTYEQCAASGNCETCEATITPGKAISTIGEPDYAYFCNDGSVIDMPVMPPEDDVKIYERKDAGKEKHASFNDIIDMILDRVQLTEEEKAEALDKAEREKQTKFLSQLAVELKGRMSELVS